VCGCRLIPPRIDSTALSVVAAPSGFWIRFHDEGKLGTPISLCVGGPSCVSHTQTHTHTHTHTLNGAFIGGAG